MINRFSLPAVSQVILVPGEFTSGSTLQTSGAEQGCRTNFPPTQVAKLSFMQAFSPSVVHEEEGVREANFWVRERAVWLFESVNEARFIPESARIEGAARMSGRRETRKCIARRLLRRLEEGAVLIKRKVRALYGYKDKRRC